MLFSPTNRCASSYGCINPDRLWNTPLVVTTTEIWSFLSLVISDEENIGGGVEQMWLSIFLKGKYLPVYLVISSFIISKAIRHNLQLTEQYQRRRKCIHDKISFNRLKLKRFQGLARKCEKCSNIPCKMKGRNPVDPGMTVKSLASSFSCQPGRLYVDFEGSNTVEKTNH